MLLRTSYFGKIKELEKLHTTKFVCISIGRPNWLPDNVLQYNRLAPPYEIVKAIKNNEIDTFEYTRVYNELLNKLDPDQVCEELRCLGDNINDDVTLLCYEKFGFCHRKLAGSFLFERGSNISKFIKG